MPGSVKMRRHMPVLRLVAAQRDAAGLARPQMHPPATNLHAFSALVRRRRLQLSKRRQVSARGFRVHFEEM